MAAAKTGLAALGRSARVVTQRVVVQQSATGRVLVLHGDGSQGIYKDAKAAAAAIHRKAAAAARKDDKLFLVTTITWQGVVPPAAQEGVL